MSKAVTNEEVEDVLSSIRRLVSEDKRPLAGLRSAPPAAVSEPGTTGGEEATPDAAPVSRPDVTDRLVLTPALRVADAPEGADAPQTSDAAAEGPLDLGSVARQTWTAPDDAQDEEVTLEDAKAYEGPMVLFPAAQDSVPDDVRDAAMDALDALVHEAIGAEMNAAAQDGIAAQEPETEEVSEGLHGDDTLVDGDYAEEGYWQDDESDDRPEADPAEDAVTDDAMLAGDDRVDESWVEGMSPAAAEPAEETLAVEKPEHETASVTRIPLTAKIAALEAAVGKIQSGWEPDGNESDAFVVTDAPAMAWEDDVELDATGAPFAQDAAAQEEAQTDEAEPSAAPQATGAGFGGDDQVMDEEALRDLVSEIVRSELQGALGERITRNVRKLVRREIHRALTAQELD